jgi:peptide/nickel transport system substrate-binding protein
MIESVAHDLLPVLEKDKNVEIRVPDHLGSTYVLRFNWKQPPFDDLKVRRAAEYALNQPDFLKANIGDPRYFKECRAMFGRDHRRLGRHPAIELRGVEEAP